MVRWRVIQTVRSKQGLDLRRPRAALEDETLDSYLIRLTIDVVGCSSLRLKSITIEG